MGSSTDYQQMINNIIAGKITAEAIWVLIQVAFWVVVVIKASKYLAKQISKYFDYDYLAQRTAEEVCKRMLIIEKQKNNAREIEEDEEIEEKDYRIAFEPFEKSSHA